MSLAIGSVKNHSYYTNCTKLLRPLVQPYSCHCEERSDEAISKRNIVDCRAVFQTARNDI